LRPAVLTAVDHVVAVIAALPAAVELNPPNYSADPRLRAFFVSIDHMRQVLRDDRALSDFLAGPAARGADRVYALLVTERQERKVLGMEWSGEMMRREVAQVSVSFGEHELIDPAANREAADELLRRRVFDHMLELALERIASAREERTGLQRERDLLRRKLAALQGGRWGFEAAAGAGDGPAMERQIQEIEGQLQGLGADAGLLEAHMDHLLDVLQHPQQQLWSNHVSLMLDHMGIKRDTAEPNTLQLELQELHGARQQSLIPLRVIIPRSEFPERPDYLAEAQRLLG